MYFFGKKIHCGVIVLLYVVCCFLHNFEVLIIALSLPALGDSNSNGIIPGQKQIITSNFLYAFFY